MHHGKEQSYQNLGDFIFRGSYRDNGPLSFSCNAIRTCLESGYTGLSVVTSCFAVRQMESNHKCVQSSAAD